MRIAATQRLSIVVIATTLLPRLVLAEELPTVTNVELQPLAAQVERLVQAMELLGAPFTDEQKSALETALDAEQPAEAIAGVQRVLDPLCLAGIHINPESRVKAHAGPARRQLMEHGWRPYFVKVHNEAGVTAPLRCLSPNAKEPYDGLERQPRTA